MKYIITLFALLVFYTVNSKTTVQTKNDSIENKITQLDKKVNSIESNYKDNIIQEYKHLNDIYSIGFTVLLGLFGIIFPYLFYIFQYKPAIKAKKKAELLLKNLEENFEKSFEKHLSLIQNKIIDKAIESYELHEDENLNDSIENFQKYQKETFTEKQIIRIIALLNRADINSDNKIFLSARLTFQKSDEIEKYFVELLRNDPNNKLAEHANFIYRESIYNDFG